MAENILDHAFRPQERHRFLDEAPSGNRREKELSESEKNRIHGVQIATLSLDAPASDTPYLGRRGRTDQERSALHAKLSDGRNLHRSVT